MQFLKRNQEKGKWVLGNQDTDNVLSLKISKSETTLIANGKEETLKILFIEYIRLEIQV